MLQFVILGAGSSGLSCGIGLLEAGHDATILEKESTVGGLCRSFRRNGFTFDYGPHFLFGPKIRTFLHDKSASSIDIPQIQRIGERIFVRDRFFTFPFDPKNILTNMPKKRVFLAVTDLIGANTLKKRRPSNNLDEWIIHSVGKTIYNYIDISGYVQKLYGFPIHLVSAEWGQQKLKFLARWRNHSITSLAVQALKEGKSLKNKVVSYPLRGIDTIPKKLAEKFIQLGGKIKTSTPATSIIEGPNAVKITSATGQEFYCDFMLSSIPLSDLVHTISGELSESVVPFLSNLRQRKTIFVLLYFDTPKVMNYQCLYFTEPQFLFRRVTEFKHISSLMAPPDKSSLCIEITCQHYEEPDISSEMVCTILKQLDKTGHFNVKDYTHYEVLNMPNTYPIYELGYLEFLRKLLKGLTSLRRIMSFGRQGLFFYNTMNNSIIDGYSLGRQFDNTVSFSSVKEKFYSKRTGAL